MPPYRSLPERVQGLELGHTQLRRDQLKLVDDTKRSAQQAEGAIEDVRTLSEAVRIVVAKVDEAKAIAVANTGQIGEVISVMGDMARELYLIREALTVGGQTDAELRAGVESAKRKASGAHHRAVALEARVSKAEDRDREFAAQMAVAKQAGVDERKALLDEMYRSVRVNVPRVVQAIAGLLVLACGVAGVLLTQKCGG